MNPAGKPVRNMFRNKVRNITVAVVTLLVILSASLVVAQSDARKSFDLLKGLEGSWAGKNRRASPLK